MTPDEKKYNRQIVEKIRSVRRAKGVTQKGLADWIGVPPSTYSDIETYRVGLSAGRLCQIARALGDPVSRYV